MEKWREEIGKKYGNLLVLEYAGKRQSAKGYQKEPVMLCKCEKCGNDTEIFLHKLHYGVKECAECARKNLKSGQQVLKELYITNGTNLSSITEVRKKNKNNTSGYTGVSYMPSMEKYRANIMFKRKQYYLGTYETPEEANAAYKEAKKRVHGEFLEWYKEKYPDKWEKLNIRN